jgi:outer membrane receptor for ferrienterochelin and colicins
MSKKSFKSRNVCPGPAGKVPSLAAAMGFLGAAVVSPAHAQPAAAGGSSNAAVTLSPLVVTASGHEQLMKDAPASITVISREELEGKPFRDLTDVLRNVEGVSITGVTGEQDISIRGMPGEYTLILVDGKPQSTRQSRPNGSGGFEQGWIPPLHAIERIEVVRGPMSSLYGSDALGGVVNIITRRVAKEWSGSAGFQTMVPTSEEAGVFHQGDFYLSGPVVKDLVGLQIFGRRGMRGEDEIIGGWSEQDNRSITGRVTITPTPDHDVVLEYGHAEQERVATTGVSAATGSATVNRRENWSVSHVGRWDFGTSDLRFFREEGERETAGSSRKPEVVNTGLRGQFVTWFGPNTLTVGGAWDRQEIVDSLGAITGNNAGQPVGGPNAAEASQYALFAEDEFAVTDNLLLTGGVRMDSHEDYGIHFSPRAYAIYHINEAFTLKGGVSTGYRTPDLRQITSGWATSTGGRGCAAANTCGVVEGNPDLKPETSITEEVSLLWSGRGGYQASVTVFNSSFEDKIENFNSGVRNADGFFVWRNENIGKAIQRGVELTFQAPLGETFLLDGNYTYTSSEIEEAPPGYPQLEGQPLTTTPRHAANLSLNWLPSDDYSAYVRMVYQGEQVRAVTRGGVSKRPATTTFDVGGSIAIAPGTSLNLAVLNVADKVVEADAAGNWLADEGRRIWVSLNAGF